MAYIIYACLHTELDKPHAPPNTAYTQTFTPEQLLLRIRNEVDSQRLYHTLYMYEVSLHYVLPCVSEGLAASCKLSCFADLCKVSHRLVSSHVWGSTGMVALLCSLHLITGLLFFPDIHLV